MQSVFSFHFPFHAGASKTSHVFSPARRGKLTAEVTAVGHSKIKRLAVFLALVFLFPVQAAAVREVVPIGHTAGIRMKSEGVLVVRLDTVQTADGERCPARDAGVREGDIIVSAGGTEVSSNAELQSALKAAQGGAVELSIKRGDETHSVQITACTDQTGVYRLGILARDSMAGIGTLTFADPQTGVFGSLGHGICDAETGVLLPLSEGDLIYSTVETVTRGKSGAPGALQGDFSDARPIGTVTKNTVHGIFGTLSDLSLLSGQGALPVAARDEIQTGDAEIIANIDGDKVQRYSVQIVRLYPENDEYGRGMMLRVTDKTLLAQTGGILQGMSGSPVVQNGRLIGAVTHVLVDDPASGYAICIDDMLREAESVA